MLQGLREARSDLATLLLVRFYLEMKLKGLTYYVLKSLRDDDPSTRNLDLSSYLLVPSEFLLLLLRLALAFCSR